MFQEHGRHAIWNQQQHPFKHTLSDFAYSNPAVPESTTMQSALDWVFAVLYPNTKPSVANVAALPAVGNTLNDYRVVLDDGDGNAASYRWEQREGEGSPSWHKIYDMDWGADSVLAGFLETTQDLYVWRNGRTDIDGAGNPITGTYAGQIIYGGNLTGQNMTLNANSADATGYIQTDNDFRPTSNNALDLGTSSLKFKTLYAGTSALVGTLTLSGGSIVDSSGAISFDNENLTTTGNVSGAVITGSTSLVSGTITVAGGSITDSTGAISFGNENLTTTGTITAATGSALADFTFTNGSIITASAGLTFGAANISTSGTLGAGNATVTRLDSDNIRVDGNTISVLDTNGNLILQANGTGIVDVQNALTTLDLTATGTVGITGQLNIDNLRLDGNVISSTNLNGNVNIHPNGTGHVNINANLHPNNDGTRDLGETANRFKDLYLSGVISDGTTSIAQSVLQSLRDINVGVGTGFSLFYDGSKWVASAPDSEIDHGTLAGLADDDHTQYMLLAGRASGQSLIGGTAAAENLSLESTSNASKGAILLKDKTTPFTNASFSGSWSGTDLGDSTHYFRDLYTRGELKGARVENFTFATLPSSSAQNVGRLAWTTDSKKMYVDNGSSFQVAGVAKYSNDETFDGVVQTLTVTVSASINDARQAIWQLLDNSNNFERIYTTIKAISATQVTIETQGALPAGSYRLIGLE